MNFFQHQSDARKRSNRLIWMFTCAVIFTCILVYLGFVFAFWYLNPDLNGGAYSFWGVLEQIPREWSFWVLGSTLGIILISSLYKLSVLKAYGGKGVVDQFPNKRVQANSKDLEEKILFNVVEEMSIASGIPMPPTYILTGEAGINAFAAGYSQSDAVVAVSQGCLDHLDRDELQGVVAHEFSHILNGDVRLNIQMSGWLFGILAISNVGRGLMRSVGRARYGRSSGRGKGGGQIILLGLVVFLIGLAGYIFGRLIQAALSRQREYLADASAVQFTRNPRGIAGALKKIKDLKEGSVITSGNPGNYSHFFFSKSSAGMNFFSTHPELDERIRLVAPSILKEPRYDPALRKKELEEKRAKSEARRESKKDNMDFISGASEMLGGGVVMAGAVLESSTQLKTSQKEEIKHLDAEWIDRLSGARKFLQDIPTTLHAKLTDADRVIQIPIILTLADDIDFWKINTPGEHAQEVLKDLGLSDIWSELLSEAELLSASLPSWKLKILELSAPALKESSKLEDVLELCSDLIKQDSQVTMFELLLFSVIYRFDQIHKSKKIRRAELRNDSILKKEKELIFALLRACQTSERKALAIKTLEIDLFGFGKALDRLSLLEPSLKEKFIREAKSICYRDQVFEPLEEATMRALSLALDCPEDAFRA